MITSMDLQKKENRKLLEITKIGREGKREKIIKKYEQIIIMTAKIIKHK